MWQGVKSSHKLIRWPIRSSQGSMARLVKNFIGGIAFKVTGGEVYEGDDEEKESRTEEFKVGEERLTEGDEEERKSYSTSDEEEEDNFHINRPPYKMATLSKWTNYISGWQDRYVVVRDGILSYYKSEIDLQYGCRGSISLHKVSVYVSITLI